MIKDFIKYLLFEKRYSEHTTISYESDLSQFKDFLLDLDSSIDLSQVTANHIRTWIVSLLEASSNPRTVNRKIASLRSFYNFQLKRELIETNPVSQIKPVKVAKSIPHFVQKREMDNLLDHVEFPSDFHGKRDQLIMELLYCSGMRLSELINLNDTDIDEYTATIKVLGKRNKERLIPISQENLKLIKAYKITRDISVKKQNNYLLVTNAGKQCYPIMINRIVKKYLTIISTVQKKSPHILRHTFATHMLDNGADLNAVKDLLGHSSLAATQVYTHNSLEKLKSAFDLAHPKA